MKSSFPIIVIGAGPAGLAAAVSLADSGIQVSIIDSAPEPGGKTTGFCCKADPDCQHCGICQIDTLIKKVTESENITVSQDCTVSGIYPGAGHFRLEYIEDDIIKEIKGTGIIWAGGYSMFDAAQKQAYHYSESPNILTNLDLEHLILNDPYIDEWKSDKKVESVAFIQCVGSRDNRLGSPYCSQTCCSLSLRLANVLTYRIPDISITIFHIDLQENAPEICQLISKLQGSIQFVNQIPAEVIFLDDNRMELNYDLDSASQVTSQIFDKIILAAGVKPNLEAAQIMENLNIKTDPFGFLDPEIHNPHFFIAGTASGPGTIANSIRDGQEAARQLIESLEVTNP